MQRSDLPFGSEFSPSQINLSRLLTIIKEKEGDWRALEEAIYFEYFQNHKTNEYNRKKLANNTKLSLIAYQIIDREANYTELGSLLYARRDQEIELYQTLARHILLNLNGLALVQCILDMQASGKTVDLLTLRQWLDQRNIHFPRGGKHPSIMRLWLAKAGIFLSQWRIDEARVDEILGKKIHELDAIATLSKEQKYYLRTIANLDSEGPHVSRDIEKLATETYGIQFNEKNLPKQVLYPLQKAGFIELQRGTQLPGRGAKPFMVRTTDKFETEIILPLLKQLEQQIGVEQRVLLRKSFAEILGELDVEDKHIKGLALEALAFKLMHLIDLNFVATRLRGVDTGGAEVDLIFDSDRLL